MTLILLLISHYNPESFPKKPNLHQPDPKKHIQNEPAPVGSVEVFGDQERRLNKVRNSAECA